MLRETRKRRPNVKALVFRQYGSPEVLEWVEVEKPAPGAGEVQIRVRAAAANPLDWHVMRGMPYGFRMGIGLRRPNSPRLGMDFAGEVEAVGAGATRFQPGDAVFGARRGAFAEFVCAPETVVARKPETVVFEEAAAAPVASITALQALRDVAGLQSGQTVLINGASGGVGTFAVQIAKWMGAEVTGVCSARNAERVRLLGADAVIDYTQQNFATSGKRYDVMIDCVGNHSLHACRGVLTERGTYVMIGGGKGRWVSPMDRVLRARLTSAFVRQRMAWMTAKANAEDLRLIGELMASGTIRAVIDRRFLMEEAAEAMRYLESGHARGKIVLVPGSGGGS
jgi:NADPH:quinone reductase-like Zn-dependent oxidoreductase